jgi:large subunit ribosomal protein L21
MAWHDHRIPKPRSGGFYVYAVMETGGRQYRVSPGQELLVEKLPGDPGVELNLDQVLMVVDESGKTLVGRPYVDGARAVATVVGQERGPKILVFKYKPKSNYRRRKGHRQDLTRIRVERIEFSS